MKSKALLCGALFTLLAIGARAQVTEMYYQGFEPGETVRYTTNASSNVNTASDLVSSGSQSLKLTQLQSGMVELITDTIDFTQDPTITYVAMEFDQIINISHPTAQLGFLYVKRVDQPQWTQLTGQNYNQTGTYSTPFVTIGNFNINSYPKDWKSDVLTNEHWKHERFDVNNLLGSEVPVSNRKLIFRFVMQHPNYPTGNFQVQSGEAWWIDNLRIVASPNQMVKPIVKMATYPDGGAYPNSRGARIVLDARTTVAQGINTDSVYLYYTIGSDLTPIRMQMMPQGSYVGKEGNTWNRFAAHLPFHGYDTTMRFYCIVKDNTTNYNTATFPDATNSWVEYHYTRGVAQPGLTTTQFTGTSNYQYMPFPSYAHNRSEWVYDSTLMAGAGYGPGSITALTFTAGANIQATTRTNFQFRMKNVSTSYEVQEGVLDWNKDYFCVVYDTTLTIPATSNGQTFTIPLMDTFFYAGGDIVMQAIYNHNADVSSNSIKMIPTAANKKSLVMELGQSAAGGNDNPFNANSYFAQAHTQQSIRPAIVMTQSANLPLLHDVGVSSIAFPTYTTAIMSVPSHLDVYLHNFGAQPINAVRISYNIDDTIPGHFDWNGNLAAGDSVLVTLTNNVVLPAGYHFVRSWVEDTVTAAGVQYRDHEPYNDTSLVEFIVCEGPLNGERQIGGANADYNTIEEFLFSLSRCGIDDSLVVKLAPGQYPAFSMPIINGHTSEHYIVYQSLNPANPATLYATEEMGVDYVVDITQMGNMRFRNLKFVRRSGTLNAMIGFGNTSDSVYIEGCTFTDSLNNPSVAERIAALVATNHSNHTVIHGNTFVGGQIGVNVNGQSSVARSYSNSVVGNTFRQQNNNAIRVENQDDSEVDHNDIYDVMTNQSYALQALECYGEVRIVGNRIRTTHGAGAMGLSALHGSESLHALVANNMIVCDDDGNANQMSSPLNVISADWTDVVYNSVKMTAPTRNNVATAIFGNGGLTNSRFLNNIVANYSNTNYALNYQPGTALTNTVGHNIYYTPGININRRQGNYYTSMATWQNAVTEDTLSIFTDPLFIEGQLFDLKTYNRIIRGVAMPLEQVTVDIYDTLRNDTMPSPGAFEFIPLQYDFQPLQLVSPMADVCDMPDSVELVLVMRNNGVRTYGSEENVNLNLVYRINGGAYQNVSINTTIPAEDTATVHTGVMLQLPPNGILDRRYTIDVWTQCTSDIVPDNDTNHYVVWSRYQANAPAAINDSIEYLSADTIVVTEGIDQWAVYNGASAPTEPSTVYWYVNPDDQEPFHKGSILSTGLLREDTTFYIRQHRELPIVRITQVMIKGNNAVGVGTLPSWMTNNTQVAVQLTNIGDDTAHLDGDSLRVISTTNSYNNKTAKLQGVTLAPGQAIVVQFNTGTTNANTVYSGGTNARITPNSSVNIGFVYRSNGVVVDAVAFNDLITTETNLNPRWETQNVPDYVWSGDGIAMGSATVGGVIREAFNGDASDWQQVTQGYTLNLGNVRSNWIRYSDNGCSGGVAAVNIIINNPPSADIEVVADSLPEGCGLTDVPVGVSLHNYGNSTIDSLWVNFSNGVDTVSELVTDTIASHGDLHYVFTTPLDLAFDKDTTISVAIWATALTTDPIHDNDTSWRTTTSLYTSLPPVLPDTIVGEYGHTAELSFDVPEGRMPVWYDYDLNPVDTGFTYITEQLYYDGNIGVSYIIAEADTGRIGNNNTTTQKTAYPSPYQPNNKHVKQQYIYSKSELNRIGITEGAINGVAFHLDSIYLGRDSIRFINYSISVGTSEDTIFKANNGWQPTELYYTADTFLLLHEYVGDWIWHEFDHMFMWDGQSSIVIQVAFDNDTNITSGVQTQYTQKSNTAISKADNNPLDSIAANYTGNGSRSANRPNIKISGANFGCNGPISFVFIKMDNIPPIDALVKLPEGTDTLKYNSCDQIEPQLIVENLGDSTLNGFRLHYFIDADTIADTTVVTDILNSGHKDTVSLFSRQLSPGRHSVRIVVNAVGDTIPENDTITTSLFVRFCGGSYAINHDSTAIFQSFGAAIDTLNAVGIDGTVIFDVDTGLYEECVSMGDIYGTDLYRIIFSGNVTDSVGVMLRGNTTTDTKTVFEMIGSKNVQFHNINIVSRPTVNNVKDANAVLLDGCSDITFNYCTLRVKGGLYDNKASVMVIRNGIERLSVSNCQLDSGYVSITSVAGNNRNIDININNNQFRNFQSRGIDLNGVSGLTIFNNHFHTGADADGRAMVGLLLNDIDSLITISKNQIYLIDEHNGGKCGMYLTNVHGTGMNNAYVTNNMIGTGGTGTNGLSGNNFPKNASGIYIDGTTTFTNIFFNTIRVYAGDNQVSSRAFCVTADPTNLQVVNNIFANLSQSHAYYITSPNSLLVSDYNAYYTNSTNKFAYWGAEKVSLAAMQNTSQKDENSVNDEPFFLANDNLHLLMTNFCDKAQYNADVMDDIDGKQRPSIPSPTIGAHEMDRLEHNMSVVRMLSPIMPANRNNPNNIEGDSVLVKAMFYNNGISTEDNVTWYAYLEGHEDDVFTVTRNIGSFTPTERKIDSVWLHTPMGIIDTQRIHVVLSVEADDDTADNTLSATAYIAPAYDFEVTKMQSSTSGCNNTEAIISMTVKNVGFKNMPVGITFNISYQTDAYCPKYVAANPDSNRITISTMPTVVTETAMLDQALNKNATRIIQFNTPANLYPTDTSANIEVKLRGWISYTYDIVRDNDTSGTASSASPVVNSYYTPNPPIGHDTTISFGCWGTISAQQENGLKVRWYRDTTASPFFNPNTYALSCAWNTTPKFFHDSTYYLQCLSDKNCPSSFSEVHVHVTPAQHDIAVENVLAPLGNRVYMENDTVRVVIANYGTSSASNFPVVYQLRKGNNTVPIQQITQICPTNIPAGQSINFTFDTLLSFANATQSGNYQLRVWTEMSNDQSKMNDTIRMANKMRPANENATDLDYAFKTLAETAYPSSANTNANSYDITRVSFNEIDIDIPSIGRKYTNLGAYSDPDVQPLHVRRGTVDSLFVTISNYDNPFEVGERGKVAVYIDFNRNGSFNDAGETVVAATGVYNNTTLAEEITIPATASLGYMRMRIVVSAYDGNPTVTLSNNEGHIVDLLLYVDRQMPTYDISLMQIVEPRSYLIRNDDSIAVGIRMGNRGSQSITSLNLNYFFDAEVFDSANMGTITWTGELASGASTVVWLPKHQFDIGTTTVRVWHEYANDEVPSNDTISYEYHRFHTIILPLEDSFDSLNYWYAPTGNSIYSKNYWQLGTPTKNRISSTHSAPNVWVTDLTSTNLSSGTRGNTSYLYSPIINISQVKPDTISFYMRRHLTGGSSLRLEYLNYQGFWVNAASDTTDPDTWYNHIDKQEGIQEFNGSDPANSTDYVKYTFPSSLISGNFQEMSQFRFAYTAPQGANNAASFGEGCAIDDFNIGRARTQTDLGVIAIIGPDSIKYGQTIYPKVIVENFGTMSVDEIELGYTTYGAFLAHQSTFHRTLASGARDTFTFDAPLVITSDFPDSITINAFTIRQSDNFKDNDTATRDYAVLPLDNDIAAVEFVSPRDHVIAGDSVSVTMRVKNFGVGELHQATFTYYVNSQPPVVETVDFDALLGHGLMSDDHFNYTFHQRFRALMGAMKVVGIVKSDQNDYIYNDTIQKHILGLSSITDISAEGIILDTLENGRIQVELAIDNCGARGVNDFEVAYYIDGDTSTIVREVYHRYPQLASLQHGYHVFEATLPNRAIGYDSITAFVLHPDDNDPSNDTTSTIVEKYFDLEAVQITVEENANPDCRVFILVRNNGNMSTVGRNLHLDATINGNNVSFDGARRIDPSTEVLVKFSRNIPKDPQRHYFGTGRIVVDGDANPTNDQTSLVRVVNYVEGTPTVNAGNLALDQNYPNPFSGTTTIPFSLPDGMQVRLFVVDVAGHTVYSTEGFYPAGDNSVSIDLSELAAGVYYYGIDTPIGRQMRKLILR